MKAQGWYPSWIDWSNAPSFNSSLADSFDQIFIGFIKPDCVYSPGQSSLASTGLEFSPGVLAVPSNLRTAIASIQAKGCKVYLSVGGATYVNWAAYNAKAIQALCKDLGVNGLEFDWEETTSHSATLTSIIGQQLIYPCGEIYIAGFSVGAYTTQPPGGEFQGNAIPALTQHKQFIAGVNIMG